MRRCNNNSRQGWGAYRPNYIPNGSSRRDIAIGHRDDVGFNRQQTDEGDREGHPTEDANHDDSVGYKLDRLLDRLNRWDSWRDEMDRRFDILEPNPYRRYDQRTGFDDGDEWHRTGERNGRGRNPSWGYREVQHETRPRRDSMCRNGPGWTTQGCCNPRLQFGGFDQSFNRPTTCWDPPQRYQAKGRGPTGSFPAQQPSQPSRVGVQSQGVLGRAAVQLRQPMVRVSQAEKAERARLGLCYYCPDKWVMGHVCKQRLLCYADEDDDVHNNDAHNGGVNLEVDVPIDESLEEIVKTDNTPRQVLVGVYDEKIGEGFVSVDDMETNNGELEKECSLFEEMKLSEKRYKEFAAEKGVIEKELNDAHKNLAETSLEWEGLANEKILILEEKSSVDGRVRELGSHAHELRDAVVKLEGSNVAYVDMIRNLESQVGEYKSKLEKVYVEREGVERCLEEVKQNALKLIMRVLVEEVYIEYAIVGNWRLKQRPCTFTFDPGGDKSPKLALSALRCFVVSTLRTRRI